MQGTVTKFAQTKNGKPTIYIDSKMYFVGRCDVSGLGVGDRIDFDAHAFSEDGKLWGLDKWGKLPKDNGDMRVTGGSAPAPFHPYETPTTGGGSWDEPMRQTCSNIINGLAHAGTLKNLDEVEMWVVAIAAAFERLKK